MSIPIISASGRNHHTLIATAPLYFFVIYWYKHVTIKNNLLVLLLIILLPITISLSVKNIIKNSVYDCFNNYYCEPSEYKRFEENIMSNTTPNLVISNHWVYTYKSNFVTKKLIEDHDKLIKEKGIVWISKELYNRSKSKRMNPYLNEIIDKSIFIKDQKNYIKLLIE